MIHLFHKWKKWSDPSKEKCLSIQRRSCQKCNKEEYRVAETFHNYKIEKTIEDNLTGTLNRNKYINRFVLSICTECNHEHSETNMHLVMDLT